MNTRDIEDDFKRNVWCLLGLPFDAVNIEFASEKIRRSSVMNKQCVISTPNLNFIVTALSDSDFRDTAISSELSLLDGMPLLWIARLLDLGVTEKVSGSDLFDYMSRAKEPENVILSVFFFGGENEAAEYACKNINAGKLGVSCAGYLNPGFGSIDLLSSPENIDKINRSQADFLIVALGAKKGQLWIDLNRTKICIPVISHLGAVINFAAAKVIRAPQWMQSSGLEWTWRIAQEPNLWHRYLFDGFAFLNLLLTKVLPYIFWKQVNKRHSLGDRKPVEANVDVGPQNATISIAGNCFHDTINPLRKVFIEQAIGSKSIIVDLSEVPAVDGAFLGLCLILFKHVSREGGSLSISGLNSNVRKIFRWNCLEFLL